MDKDDVIRMAREAGFANAVWTPNFVEPFVKFAALVAEQEREECARISEGQWTNCAEKLYGIECAATIRARGNT